MSVAVSWRDMVNLVDNIKNNLIQITDNNKTLEQQLATLGTSFIDEDILIIQNHINATKKKIEEAVPEFTTVLNKMMEYATEVKIAEDAIHKT